MLLDAHTTGSAGLTVVQCGVSRACDAWRQLSDAVFSLRADNTIAMLSKIMNAKVAFPDKDKDLQGYITEWERDLEFYFKATGTQGIIAPQHEMSCECARQLSERTWTAAEPLRRTSESCARRFLTTSIRC